jgi:UDP-N-acetylmuramyl pentapeptide synthase
LDVEVGMPTRCEIALPDGEVVELALRTFGAHNARNAASALAVGHHLGIDRAAMVQALDAVEPVGDRGRVHAFGHHLLIADCYNANPGSMDVALRSLAALEGYTKVAVLGDMLELGPTEDELHAGVGSLCKELGIDHVLGFGPRSRHLAEAAGGEHFDDIDPLVGHLRALLDRNDRAAVLFKASRGLKLERSIEALRAG